MLRRFFRTLLRAALRLLYRVELRGLDRLAEAHERSLVVVNHVSFLDGPLLAVFLPGDLVFAVNLFRARDWWIRPFLSLADCFLLDPTRPVATKSLIKAVRQGRRCVIFPEGRLTVTGSLMKIYEGPGMIADAADAVIVPVRIDGAQYTPFSRLRGKLRLRPFPKIVITVLPPRRFQGPEGIVGRERRHRVGLELYDVMTRMMFESSDIDQTLIQGLHEARAVYGGGSPAVEDTERQPLSYNRLLAGAYALGRHLAAETEAGACVGILLPNMSATAVAFFALHAGGRVPAMLNYTAGAANMMAACAAAQLRSVVTSRRFVAAAKLEETLAVLEREVTVLYLEDIAARIGLADKLYGLAACWLGLRPGARAAAPGDPAVVLFTSGTEGSPKGVALSHRNLMANRYQLSAVIDFSSNDIVFNALPLFHAFGLSSGLLLPLLSGVKTVLYPSPLHYRMVPAMSYLTNATIFFATDTFLAGYARTAHAYDFFSPRYVFAGAERLQAETKLVWMQRFGLRILEGYGATETSPVLAMNTPMNYRDGSVGRFLPAVTRRIEPVEGIDRGGRLFVKAPNVMLGYLTAESPGELQPPDEGWYDTGDIVEIDEEGFVTIAGRAKRFAKIGGEMISLTAVENLAAGLWPDHQHAVVSFPDPKKGEQLVLATTCPEASIEALAGQARASGHTELMVPRKIAALEEIPLLATGKTDYGTLARTLQTALEGPAS